MTTLLPWILLNSINGIGPVRFGRLLQTFGSAQTVCEQPPGRLAEFGVRRQDAEALRDPKRLDLAKHQIEMAEKIGARIITLEDEQYPPLLKEIFAPPPVIYVKGLMDVFSRNAVAMVGTRRFTEYGKTAAAHIVSELVGSGVVIVSGLALGIDTIAHTTCVERHCPTIAVFGTGIDQIYPAANRGLSQRIIAEGGALVSEFPIGSPGMAHNFPRRNRIISGLASGVVVVEAPLKSGSLITVGYALQQNRTVYAVPGSIFSLQSEGCFDLLQSGATPVRCGGDILRDLQTTSLFSKNVARESTPPAAAMALGFLSDSERTVYDVLSSDPQRLDEIADRLKKAVNELFDIMLTLELKGVIRQVAGQSFVKL